MAVLLAYVAISLIACWHECGVGAFTTPAQGVNAFYSSHSRPNNAALLSSSCCLSYDLITTQNAVAAATAALQFHDEMVKVGPNWAHALQSWQCPTPAATSNVSCDPCGVDVWYVLYKLQQSHHNRVFLTRHRISLHAPYCRYGNFEHFGCRAGTTEGIAHTGSSTTVTVADQCKSVYARHHHMQ